MEIQMTLSEPTKAVNLLPGDSALTIRRYLRNRPFLLAVAIIALVAGAAINWGWLVALGIAPLLLSVLPCVVMCGLGFCCMKMMASSSEKQAGQSGNAAETAESLGALGIARLNEPSLDGPSCCHGDVKETAAPPVIAAQQRDEAPIRNTAGTR
jgi:hypothetical protein